MEDFGFRLEEAQETPMPGLKNPSAFLISPGENNF